MTTGMLQGRRVLVVEDEYLLANELGAHLGNMGAVVIGPVGNLDGALALVRETEAIDVAVLDLNLGGVSALPLAEVLAGRQVPLVFATGYDGASIPPAYAGVPTCLKPVARDALLGAITRAMRVAHG